MPKKIHGGVHKRCDCPTRAWAKCPHPWYFAFHHAGTKYRLSLDVEARKRNEDPPTSKSAALKWRDKLRSEIRDRKYTRRGTTAASGDRRTVGEVMDRYLRDYVPVVDGRPRREGGRKLMETYIAALRRVEIPATNDSTIRLEQVPIADVTTADVNAIREGWKRRTGAAKGGRVGADRALKRLRHMFHWAIENGLVNHTPFRRHGVVVVHFQKDQRRSRRLEPGEEERLLQHADPHLHALIVAALDTGLRRGELLGLQWRDVKAAVFALPAELTKTNTPRAVPITPRVRAVLDLRKYAPDGREHSPEAYVFGNEVGERVQSIRDQWTATTAAAHITGLHFHDLRREFGSRFLESGALPHQVRDALGHADLNTTDAYLSTSGIGLQHAFRQFHQHRGTATKEALINTLKRTEQPQYAEADLMTLSVEQLQALVAFEQLRTRAASGLPQKGHKTSSDPAVTDTGSPVEIPANVLH